MTRELPPYIAVARIQRFGDRFILAEDKDGRHFMLEKDDHAPIREIVLFDPNTNGGKKQ